MSEMKTKVSKCWNVSQHVRYPAHEIGDDGQCQHCHAWFAQAKDSDAWDETIEYASQDERDEAVW